MSTEETQPTEEELRAAYEAELSRITTGDMILQTAASLLNIGGLRLGLGGGRDSQTKVERDLDQVRDAIDGVRALLPIIERHGPEQLRPLRDALSQLQMAYAREAQAAAPGGGASGERTPGGGTPGGGAPGGGEQGGGGGKQPPGPAPTPPKSEDPPGPGPAQSSGRLWVPGR